MNRKIPALVLAAMFSVSMMFGASAEALSVNTNLTAAVTVSRGRQKAEAKKKAKSGKTTAVQSGSTENKSNTASSSPATAEIKTGSGLVPQISFTKQSIPNTAGLNFTKNMKLGWNLGNTFDATGSGYANGSIAMESSWCGIKTSKKMIDTIKASGFNTVRIPVSWHNHVSGDNYTIDKEWMDRVQEVVDYVIDNDMYCIINIHHDDDKSYLYPTSENMTTSTKYVTAIWSQVSERFADYGDKLIFESMNEPRMKGTNNEWWLDMNNDSCKDSVECLNKLNQTFVNTVRKSGGRNATRYLMTPGYAASLDGVTNSLFKIANDPANRIIISVHAYTPYNFALNNGGTSKWSVNSASDKREIDNLMNKIYNKFIKNGTPVVIGEFGARDKKGNLQARTEFSAYYIAAARANGITCCWWDNNAYSGSGELFGILNRTSCTMRYPEIVEALNKYAK